MQFGQRTCCPWYDELARNPREQVGQETVITDIVCFLTFRVPWINDRQLMLDQAQQPYFSSLFVPHSK
ncbi:MAG: hypothetical protein CMJ62_11245 [Planctomycetaceae bacterium]|nr:hypothetical protein [Planctomycetaceae bacterium]